METLGPGAYFKIGETGFEYQGTRLSPADPSVTEIVARINPEIPLSNGAIHTILTVGEVEKGVKIGPFNELFPYSTYIRDKSTLQGLFGPEFEVPYPPQELIDIQKNAKEAGIDSFEPHFIPKGTVGLDHLFVNDKYHPYGENWKALDKEGFFDRIMRDPGAASTGIFQAALELPGKWILFDTTERPNYNRGEQMYGNGHDPFKSLIQHNSDFNSGSRFNLSFQYIQQDFNRYLGRALKIYDYPADQQPFVTIPSAVIFNFLGNLYYPQLGETNTDEWFRDAYKMNGMQARLIGGDSDLGGLAGIANRGALTRDDAIGFRPMILFSTQGGNK